MSKKLFVFVAVVVALSFMVTATSLAQFVAEKNYLGPCIGLSFLGSVPEFGANYEYGMDVKNFGLVGIGGLFRYWSYSEGYLAGKWSYTNILIGAQGNYHFKLVDTKIDPWLGLILAYDGGSVNGEGLDGNYATPTHGGVFLGAHGGARYWLSPNLAVTGRIGFGSLSYGSLDVGVDFKF
jgi:hypothetical protein